MGTASSVVAPFSAAAMFRPDLVGSHVALGPSGISRAPDHMWGAAVAGSIVAAALGVASIRFVSRHSRRLMTDDDGSSPVVIEPAWITRPIAGGYTIVGIAASVLLIAPTIVPIAFLAAGGLGPALILLGVNATRRERLDGRPAWLRYSPDHSAA